MTGVPVHSWNAPGGVDESTMAALPDVKIEQYRWMNNVDLVRAFGRVWTFQEADVASRLLRDAAMLAAAHNAGALAS